MPNCTRRTRPPFPRRPSSSRVVNCSPLRVCHLLHQGYHTLGSRKPPCGSVRSSARRTQARSPEHSARRTQARNPGAAALRRRLQPRRQHVTPGTQQAGPAFDGHPPMHLTDNPEGERPHTEGAYPGKGMPSDGQDGTAPHGGCVLAPSACVTILQRDGPTRKVRTSCRNSGVRGANYGRVRTLAGPQGGKGTASHVRCVLSACAKYAPSE